MMQTSEYNRDDHVKLISLVDFLKTTESVLFINTQTEERIARWVEWLKSLDNRLYDATGG